MRIFFYNFIVIIKIKGHGNNITARGGVKHLFIGLISSVFYEDGNKPKGLTRLSYIGLQKYLSNDKTDLNFSCLFFRKHDPNFSRRLTHLFRRPFLIRWPFEPYWHKFFLLFPSPGTFLFFRALINDEKRMKNRLIKIVQCFWNNVYWYNSSECSTLFFLCKEVSQM